MTNRLCYGDNLDILGEQAKTRVSILIRDLHSAMEREKTPIGVSITKALPTSVMEREVAAVGRFQFEVTKKSHAKLQIITLTELFRGKKPDIPYVDPTAGMKRAVREDMATQDRQL